ncbi:MAG: S8 family serine peptidase [Deltaproteobacteria bacterium]|nr:S8 family serine peptidase [Deltaproteobacteria bacterium]MBW1793552.1 S8 family serine peptidase [Deltaproteobacteria bacterium]MBW2330618.1 S8 family serine peptidase [Deltaproteobacteria bacterium]
MAKKLLAKFWKSGKTLLTFLVLAMMCITLTGSIGFAGPGKRSPGKKRILVHYRAGMANSEMKKSVQRHRGRIVRHLRGINVRVVEVSDDENVTAVIENLSRDPFVKFAEEDRLVPPEEISANDPYYDYAWHLGKIKAPSAWETSMGDGVVVAVLDTGVDEDHPDLFGQTVPGWNIYDDDDDTSDVYGHGTRVAGTVAAASDNGIGVTSIAWHALVMPVRISRPDGYAYISDIAEGITWAADNGAKVANISYDVSASPTIQNAASYMRESGGVVVVAGGNREGYRSIEPSPALISVGATDSSDVRALFSAYGEYLDLVAPGVGIYSTRRGGDYSAASGTSFSSPIVAAVAALVMSVNPALDPAQVDTILRESADDLGDEGDDIYYGSGRVNAAEAVLAAWESSNEDIEAPTVAITSPAPGSVSGVVPIDVSATDDVGVTRVELYIDGELVGTETSEPFGFSWDSTTVPDGTVTLVAYAYDSAGNEGISSPVTLDVQNEPDPEICGDLDADGDVDYYDYMIFRGTLGLHAGDPDYVEKADFDGDQRITLIDFWAWYGCYQDYLRGR